MNKLTISRSAVLIEITGWDKIWSFKGSLVIPKGSISRVYRHDGKLRPPWGRCPGTALPKVIIAGTYYGRGRKEFWNTHFREGTLVFDLKDADYTRIVVDVDDPDKILAQLADDKSEQSTCTEPGDDVAVPKKTPRARGR